MKTKTEDKWAFLTVSASQLKTKIRCTRCWAFQKLYRLPQEIKDYFTFGTCLHECNERFLRGKEIFPDGWDDAVEEDEAELIKILVEKGIEQGILVPEPGNLIEQEFKRPLITDVDICGFIDVLNFNIRTIADHKTAKNSRYLLTKDTIKEDIQMLIYAKSMVDSPKDSPVNLVHNQFIKDPLYPKVRQTVGQASAQEVLNNWARVEQWAREMRDLKKIYLASGAGREYPYRDIEMGEAKACNAYGGCPFQGICNGRETVNQYVRRITRLNTIKERGTVGMFSDMKKAAVDVTPEPQPEPKCKACGDTKKGSKGGNCRACSGLQEAPKTEEPKPAATKRKGRQPGATQKFTLAIGCAATGRGITHLSEIYTRVKAEIEKELDTDFLAVDPFKRRDMFEPALAQIEMPKGIIVGELLTPDLKALVAALEPLAGSIIRGVA